MSDIQKVYNASYGKWLLRDFNVAAYFDGGSYNFYLGNDFSGRRLLGSIAGDHYDRIYKTSYHRGLENDVDYFYADGYFVIDEHDSSDYWVYKIIRLNGLTFHECVGNVRENSIIYDNKKVFGYDIYEYRPKFNDFIYCGFSESIPAVGAAFLVLTDIADRYHDPNTVGGYLLDRNKEGRSLWCVDTQEFISNSYTLTEYAYTFAHLKNSKFMASPTSSTYSGDPNYNKTYDEFSELYDKPINHDINSNDSYKGSLYDLRNNISHTKTTNIEEIKETVIEEKQQEKEETTKIYLTSTRYYHSSKPDYELADGEVRKYNSGLFKGTLVGTYDSQYVYNDLYKSHAVGDYHVIGSYVKITNQPYSLIAPTMGNLLDNEMVYRNNVGCVALVEGKEKAAAAAAVILLNLDSFKS